MNHVADRSLRWGAPFEPSDRGADPLRNAAAAVELNLALAHEQGRTDQVRLLHAVLALLADPPRN
ncbi:hypothetical protein [Neoroseomonas oryzicola]|uniref:Uncharacterized protein n=1 Tax=Neoroseomonas oryzicola TaxID=535904 RepID=A0A9X9WC44_9PROT|nr:hypothetical protein [Neoroseomonas oryzicola]MBR0657904.1 hypothetical protein [Neoroseomonas oryzicola]NKE18778.1 hypothetical protein [Neoroseomonas oryzicola]